LTSVDETPIDELRAITKQGYDAWKTKNWGRLGNKGQERAAGDGLGE